MHNAEHDIRQITTPTSEHKIIGLRMTQCQIAKWYILQFLPPAERSAMLAVNSHWRKAVQQSGISTMNWSGIASSVLATWCLLYQHTPMTIEVCVHLITIRRDILALLEPFVFPRAVIRHVICTDNVPVMKWVVKHRKYKPDFWDQVTAAGAGAIDMLKFLQSIDI
jgi:hypothetical protein